MHRSLISSGDFLDKLITLYPSAQHSQIETEWFFFLSKARLHHISSSAAFCFFVVVNSNRQSKWYWPYDAACSCAKYDRQVAVRVYACCQYIAICTRIHPSLWVLYLLTTITKLMLATSILEEHVFYSIW